MKKYIGLLALMSLFLFVACNAEDPPFAPGSSDGAFLGGLPEGAIPFDVSSSPFPASTPRLDFLSENEQAMLDEMNYARTRPKDYAYNVLKPFLDNNCYSKENRETYVQTAFDTMVAMKPVAPLQAAKGLTFAARDFIADPGRNVHGSSSPGFAGLGKRASYYGSGGGGEIAWPNGGFGDGTGTCYPAETATSGWIIDRGNAPGYGHRKAILSAGNRYIGLAFGYGAPDAKVEGYRDSSATYATLAGVRYIDRVVGDYKGGAAAGTATDPLTLTSISEVVTWPVLRYEDGKFFEYDAAGVKGAEETRRMGGRTVNVR